MKENTSKKADKNDKNSSSDSTTQQNILNIIEKNQVVLFMKGTKEFPQCGFSGIAVAILKHYEVDFLDVNVLAVPNIREGIKIFSSWPTIPQLYVNKKFIGGSDIMKELHEEGEFQKILTLKS